MVQLSPVMSSVLQGYRRMSIDIEAMRDMRREVRDKWKMILENLGERLCVRDDFPVIQGQSVIEMLGFFSQVSWLKPSLCWMCLPPHHMIAWEMQRSPAACYRRSTLRHPYSTAKSLHPRDTSSSWWASQTTSMNNQ